MKLKSLTFLPNTKQSFHDIKEQIACVHPTPIMNLCSQHIKLQIVDFVREQNTNSLRNVTIAGDSQKAHDCFTTILEEVENEGRIGFITSTCLEEEA
jgi:hypothetical protein